MTGKRAEARRTPFWGIGNRIAPPRFLIFIAIVLATAAVLMRFGWSIADSLQYGFDLGGFLFLASILPLLKDSDAATMRIHSKDNDAARLMVLTITMVMSIAVFAAITGDLADAKKGSTIAMVSLIGTLFLAWAFTNTVFALHYAHAYYSTEKSEGGDVGGIDFPGTKEPDYWDFMYFSFAIGQSFATSDTNITRGGVRRVVMAQGIVAFIYNIGVVAFIINGLGGGSG